MACGSCGGRPGRKAAGATAKCLTCAHRFYPASSSAEDLDAVLLVAEEHARITGHTIAPLNKPKSRTAGIKPPPDADPFVIDRTKADR